MNQSELHRLLMQPAFYPLPDRPLSVEHRETHISHVYILDHLVFKMKKPVNFGFLDFTSLEKRKFFCEEEVRLNRRFCPDTYLDVTAVCADSAGIHLWQPGEPIEYLVMMIRLPEDRMLSHLLAADSPELPELMTCLGSRLARVHLSLPSCAHDEGFSELDHVSRNWEENFMQTESGIGRIIPAHGFAIMRNFVHDFLSEHAGLIEAREQQGWVRE
ncbi:MAG TPA: hypothetical protein VK445_06910, partial [Dissulfurispiraceae bacterium]|nr:hypothetical protein [Dissulfurispiraceae bacterium]